MSDKVKDDNEKYEEWIQMVKDYYNSGLSIYEFCKRIGIAQNTFAYRTKQLRLKGLYPDLTEYFSRWVQTVKDFQASGLTREEFCEGLGIKTDTLKVGERLLRQQNLYPEADCAKSEINNSSELSEDDLLKWAVSIDELQRSNKTAQEWCEHNGIRLSEYYKWKRKTEQAGLLCAEPLDCWKRVVDECNSSGMPWKEWCRSKGISIGLYMYRLGKLKKAGLLGQKEVEPSNPSVDKEITTLQIVTDKEAAVIKTVAEETAVVVPEDGLTITSNGVVIRIGQQSSSNLVSVILETLLNFNCKSKCLKIEGE